jgi:hypothetical protein
MVFLGRKHHLSLSSGYAYKHRFIAEQIIGRKLKKGEQVHHRDENKKNNHPLNLEICTHKEHKFRHRKKESNRRRPWERNPLIKCACGCNGKLRKYSKYGNLRTLIYTHRVLRRGSKSRRLFERNIKIRCACGCGRKIMRFDRYNRIRSRIQGHIRGIRRKT